MTQLNETGERLIPIRINKTAIEHLHRYAFCFEYIKGKIVLDIASGEGYGSNLLSKYAEKVVGVDISEEAVSHANALYGKDNLSFKIGDVLNIPFESETFDVVISFETIEHITDHQKMVSEIKRVLNRNGILIISTPEKSIYSDMANYANPYHEKELYEAEFFEILSNEFQFLQMGYQKYLSGSYIKAAKERGRDLTFFTGDFEKIESQSDLNHEYLIAICSNEILEKSFFSNFFYNDSFLSKEIQILEELLIKRKIEVKKGFRYQLIDFIFKPWDLFKIILKKNTK